MNQSTIDKVILAKRMFNLATEVLKSSNDASLRVGVNLLQDAAEAFLLAVSEHTNAGVNEGTKFNQYLDLIDAKIKPKELPFRAKLLALNKLRVNAKHYGITPAKSEVDSCALAVREFFDETAKTVFGVPLQAVSVLELLKAGEVKDFLAEAQANFLKGEFEECLIACRKAIYVRFEWMYDISRMNTETGLAGLFSRAPIYARNQKYIDEQVKKPTDYIVLDHSALELDLLSGGLDSVSFWNIWRLTPALYRKKDKTWVVERELEKLEADGIRERAEYVLDATISLFLVSDQRMAATKTPDRSKRYYADLKREEVPIFEKADATSKQIKSTPKGIKRIFIDYEIESLDGKDRFLHIAQVEAAEYFVGYIQMSELAE